METDAHLAMDTDGKRAALSKPGWIAAGVPAAVIAAMEFFEIIAELFVALDGLTAIADLYAWMRGKDNRVVRKEARRRGEPVPPRDNWNRWAIVLTLLFFVLTTVLILWTL